MVTVPGYPARHRDGFRDRRRLAFVPSEYAESAGVLMGCKKRPRSTILRHAKAIQIRRNKTLRGHLPTSDRVYRDSDHGCAGRLTARSKYIGRHIQRIRPHREVGKIQELPGYPKAFCGDVEKPPTASYHVGGLGEGEALNVVGLRSSVGAVLEQPNESID